jgi:hypothetical protein
VSRQVIYEAVGFGIDNSRKNERHRAAEQRDELAPFHSITSSALACSVSLNPR